MKACPLLAAVLLSCPAMGQSAFMVGDELASEVARNCANGCVVLSPDEVAAYQAALSVLVAQRAEAAKEAGKAEAQAECRNRI